jgi:1-aminocyclopropane-1-carboxylate deaminase
MFNLESKIQSVETPFLLKAGVRLFMKRDDQIHPFVSGNKWYKLKYNIEAFKASNHSKLVTFGGAYSNHLIATAATCAAQGIKCLGVVRGDELNSHSNFVLRLCKEFGMELSFVTRNSYKDQQTLSETYEKEGFFVIPEGGENILGRKGCEEIVSEVSKYDHIILPVGTATTLAGVVNGSKGHSHVHGISAVGDAAYLNDRITMWTNYKNWTLHTAYSFGGFGRYDQEQVKFNQEFVQQTGILLDPVYTGKMIRGIYELINQKLINRNQVVLCIHTGGLTGLLSETWLKS